MYFDFSIDLKPALKQELERFQEDEKISVIPEECIYEGTQGNQSAPAEVRKFCELLCAVNGPTVQLSS